MAGTRRVPDHTTDSSVPIPRDANGHTPDPYTPGSPHVRANFGTPDGGARVRETKVVNGQVTSADPQPRTDGYSTTR